MIHRAWLLAMLVLWALLLPGCRAALPVYPPMSDDDALRTIADRQAGISSISAECGLVLTSEDGQSIHLDAVLVAQPPRRARLRAWKFGRAVLDLTIIDGGVWLVAPEDQSPSHRIDPQRTPARQVSDAIGLLGPAYFRAAHMVATGASTFTVSGPALGRDDLLCEIDRATLTPRRFFAPGDPGAGYIEMCFEDYALVENIPWALTMRFHGSGGEIVIRLHDIELNGEIAAGAFVPPQQAIRLP